MRRRSFLTKALKFLGGAALLTRLPVEKKQIVSVYESPKGPWSSPPEISVDAYVKGFKVTHTISSEDYRAALDEIYSSGAHSNLSLGWRVDPAKGGPR